MTDERMMVMNAVFAGQIDNSHVTLEELEELGVRAGELIMDCLIEDAYARGCTVFSGESQAALH